MHSAIWPFWSPGDSQSLLNIEIQRISWERFEERRRETPSSRLYQQGDANLKEFLNWLDSWHSSIDRLDWKSRTYFRYDTRCADTSAVTMHVELLSLQDGVPVHEAEDERAIRRVLSSVECKEVPPVKEVPPD